MPLEVAEACVEIAELCGRALEARAAGLGVGCRGRRRNGARRGRRCGDERLHQPERNGRRPRRCRDARTGRRRRPTIPRHRGWDRSRGPAATRPRDTVAVRRGPSGSKTGKSAPEDRSEPGQW